MIRVCNLFKSFADRPALRGIDLDVAEGERLALVGPNGAGKTTLLRILAALSQPSQGSVRLAGVDLGDGAHAIRRQVGFLSHQPLLYADLSAEENLRFYGRMYDVPDLEQRIATMLRQVGLASSRGDLVRTFSRGMRQRLAIARALLHDPPVLLLDEPFTGLDRQAAQMLDAVLDASAGARTVVMTTHDLERGWQIGDRLAMLIAGRIAYQMDGKDRDLDAFRREYERQTASGGR